MDVLVTDGITKHALTVVRAIADETDATGVAARYPVSMAGASRYADRRHELRSRADEAVVDELNHLVRTAGYDHVLPVGGETFELVSTYRDRLDPPVERFLPAREAVDTALDKLAVHELAREVDVPTPRTERPASPDELSAAAEAVGLPAVVKAGHENDGRFVEVVEDEAELRTAYAACREHSDRPLVQAYLPGEGCGYFGCYADGEPIGRYAHRRVREYPPSGGASACAESRPDDELSTYGHRLLSALSWTGVVMVEFKRDADGRPHLVEINPKLWGSLELGVRSGMNFPVAMLALADGREPPALSLRERRVHWPLSGDLQHAARRPRSAPSVLRDLVSPRTRSNVDLTDPLPHVVEAGKALARGVA